MQKIILLFFISILANLVKAETLTSHTNDKLQAIPSLESAMSQSINVVAVKKLNNIPLSQSGINLTLNNQWQLMISSSNKIKISQISITLDRVTIANQVDFDLGKTRLVHYSIATNGLKLQRFNGYTFFGFTNQVLANEYIDYQTLLIKKIQVTIAWNNEQTYNESTTNLLMVYAK